MKELLTLTVMGQPQAAGSKRPFPIRRKGKIVKSIVVDANPNSREWKNRIALAAQDVIGKQPVYEGAVHAEFVFHFSRPKSHYGSGRNSQKLKPSAPLHHTQKPDALKVTRGVEDALSKIVYKDDSQIVNELILKQWGERDMVEIKLFGLE